MMNELYYLNLGCCSTKRDNYLEKSKHLSEYLSDLEKKAVKDNLGISGDLERLENLINKKVLESNTITWDNIPTKGNTDRVISSDSLYTILSKYISNNQLNENNLKLWNTVLNKINEIYNKSECELNEVKNYLEQEINLLKCELNNYTTSINQLVRELKTLITTFIGTPTGQVLSTRFGDSDDIGITQKALKDEFNKIWDVIESILGTFTRGIRMNVSPKIFTGDTCIVNITASSLYAIGKFENISIYANEQLVAEGNDTDCLQTSITISETTEIKCIATILGVSYEKKETITKHNAFWMSGGNYSTTEHFKGMIENDKNIIPINNDNMRGAYDISLNQGNYLYIVLLKQLESKFIRADLNGSEIPFNKSYMTIDDKEYVIYKSVNEWNSGTYNIDING